MEKKIKWKKVWKRIIIIVGIILLLVWYFIHFILINNIFDQMYYSRVRYHYDWFGSSRGTMFSDMKQLENISRDMELWHTQERYFTEEYKEEYSSENQHIFMTFYANDKKISFYIRWDFPDSDERLWLDYMYDVQEKTLTKKPISLTSDIYGKSYHTHKETWMIDDFLSRKGITRDEIEELYEWLLYERILPDFIEANKSKTRFRMNRLGKYDFIDETTSVIEE